MGVANRDRLVCPWRSSAWVGALGRVCWRQSFFALKGSEWNLLHGPAIFASGRGSTHCGRLSISARVFARWLLVKVAEVGMGKHGRGLFVEGPCSLAHLAEWFRWQEACKSASALSCRFATRCPGRDVRGFFLGLIEGGNPCSAWSASDLPLELARRRRASSGLAKALSLGARWLRLPLPFLPSFSAPSACPSAAFSSSMQRSFLRGFGRRCSKRS